MANFAEAEIDLSDPTSDLLTQGDRRGVLEMGSANLDDVGVRRGLAGKRVSQ